MLARLRAPITHLGTASLVGMSALLVLVVPMGFFATVMAHEESGNTGLLNRARLGTWYLPAQADPPVISHGYDKTGPNEANGYQESDFNYVNGKYYLFATGSEEPAWVDVYEGDTPEELVEESPVFTNVAQIRYPTVVKDGDTWHMWGVNPAKKRTEHWISTNAEPTDFHFADAPFPESPTLPMVDFAVRKHPTNGYWYAVGFEPWNNSPLLLAKSPGPAGPWEKLNYVKSRPVSGVFGDTGAPPWAAASRPDPNLAFTPDGRSWIFFTGKPVIPQPVGVTWRGGVVEVNIDTGKAIGNAVVLFDPNAYRNLPIRGASDLNLVSVPGQPDRIFAQTDSANYPLALLDLPDAATFIDERTSADLVRLDMATGIDVATGMAPVIAQAPYDVGPEGPLANVDNGAASYLASAYLADLTFYVDFTPTTIKPSAINAVAHIGGADYEAGSGITVQIDATRDDPRITVNIMGSDKSNTVLDSGIIARPNTRYSVVLRRLSDTVRLIVNGVVTTTAKEGTVLTNLEGWSLAAEATMGQENRYPFQGVIHSFMVTGNGTALADSNDPGLIVTPYRTVS